MSLATARFGRPVSRGKGPLAASSISRPEALCTRLTMPPVSAARRTSRCSFSSVSFASSIFRSVATGGAASLVKSR